MSPLTGALLGLAAGAGLALVAARLPLARRPRLEDRLAPYLRASVAPSRLLAVEQTWTPLPSLERILAPFLAEAVAVLERVLGGTTAIRRRLDAAGRPGGIERFRAEQLFWAAAGLLAGAALGGLAAQRGRGTPLLTVLVAALAGAVAGALARDRWLSHQIEARSRRIVTEFPTVAELLALAVSAGESPVAALERVARTARGELAGELARALAEARAGAAVVTALSGIAERTSVPALVRFVDGVVVALQRGTPLAEVLRAQAGDVRELGKRALMETGGRKEIAMMVPVVFLVLPVTIVFALFPGLASLRLTL